MFGVEDKLHCAVIYIVVVKFNFGIIFSLHFCNNFTPHTAGTQNVSFINAGNFTATFFSSFESKFCNAFYFRTSVEFNVTSFFNAISIDVSFVMFAKVNATSQFANDEEVSAFSVFSFQRGKVSSKFGNGHGAKVAVQAQSFADTEQAFFRTNFRSNIIPFGTANCT